MALPEVAFAKKWTSGVALLAYMLDWVPCRAYGGGHQQAGAVLAPQDCKDGCLTNTEITNPHVHLCAASPPGAVRGPQPAGGGAGGAGPAHAAAQAVSGEPGNGRVWARKFTLSQPLRRAPCRPEGPGTWSSTRRDCDLVGTPHTRAHRYTHEHARHSCFCRRQLLLSALDGHSKLNTLHHRRTHPRPPPVLRPLPGELPASLARALPFPSPPNQLSSCTCPRDARNC